MRAKIFLILCMLMSLASHAQEVAGKWVKEFESNGFPGMIQFQFSSTGEVEMRMSVDMSMDMGGGRGIFGKMYSSIAGKYTEENGYLKINFDKTTAKAWNDIKVRGVDAATKNQFMTGLKDLMKEQKQELIQIASDVSSQRCPYHFEGYGKYLNLDGTLLTSVN